MPSRRSRATARWPAACARTTGPPRRSASRHSGRPACRRAGHPPGIVAHRDGRAELLEEGRSLSLAIEPGRRRSDTEGWLRTGAILLLYTDGLVERRRRPLTAGIAAVAATLQDGHGLPVQDLASRVVTALAPSGGYEDDVALVLYRHAESSRPEKHRAAVDTGRHISRTRQKEAAGGGRPAAPATMPTGARHDGLVCPGWLA
jgi:hypothetical protein